MGSLKIRSTVRRKGTKMKGTKKTRKVQTMERRENMKQKTLTRVALLKNTSNQLVPRTLLIAPLTATKGRSRTLPLMAGIILVSALMFLPYLGEGCLPVGFVSFSWALIFFLQNVLLFEASILRIRLPLQRHKDPELLPSEEQPCQFPLKTHKNPVVLSREKQPCQLPLQKRKDRVVLPKEEQPCRLSLQRNKDPEALPSPEQPCWLSPQRQKGAEVLPSQEEPSRLSFQRPKGPDVLPSLEQPSRLSLQRPKGPEVLPSQGHPCSSSGRTDNAFVEGLQEPAPKQGIDEGRHPRSTSGNASNKHSSRRGKEKHRKSSRGSFPSQYRELIENWVQPPLSQCLPMDVDDEGWFEAKTKWNCGVEKRTVVSDSLSYSDATSWPRAHLFPESDIYALPYTVPF